MEDGRLKVQKVGDDDVDKVEGDHVKRIGTCEPMVNKSSLRYKSY